MIREATHSDIPRLISGTAEFFDGILDGTGLVPDPVTIEFFIQDLIDLEDSVVFVAEEDGEVVGAILGKVHPWMFNHNTICLTELGWFVPTYTREKYPKAGISLLMALRKWGKAMNATQLVMTSTKREESPRVMQMYDKMGLVHIDSNFIGRL